MSPLLFAIAHHLLVFSIAGVLAAEAGLVRRGMTAADAVRVGKIDAWYGILAGLIVAVGLSRAAWGAKGWDYYTGNPWFWAKMASFAAVGVLSIPPTVAFIRWRRAQKAGTLDAPTDAEVSRVRRWFWLQALFLALVPAFAAAMAGWGQ